MKVIYKLQLVASLLFILHSSSSAQHKPPFYDDVQAIKGYDKVYSPPQHPILFIGSSSIRLWVNFAKTFNKYVVLNRGIGGAVTNDTDRYLDDLVFPYEPKQVVIYVGENDVIKANGGAEIFEDFKKLYTHLRTGLPSTPVIYIAIKGSPSRAEHLPKVVEANALIKTYIETASNIIFLDVYRPMLTKKGEMRPELFKEDMLHMNADGYKIWNKLLIPHLLKD